MTAVKGSQEREAGRSLDAEVAERVMGWRWRRASGGGWDVFIDAADYLVGATREEDGTVIYLKAGFLPHYSTDIAAAFQVVEAMAKREPHPWGVTIKNWHHYGAEWWTVVFRSHPLGPPPVEAKADTLAHAISLAALAALDAEQSSAKSAVAPLSSSHTPDGAK